LHAAVTLRYTPDSRPFIRMLLEAGADPGVRTSRGETALESAERLARADDAGSGPPKRHAEVAQLLHEAGGK